MSKFYLLNLFLLLSMMASAQKLIVEANPVQRIQSDQLRQQFNHYQIFQIDLRELNRETGENKAVIPVLFQFGEKHNWQVRLIPNDIRSENYKLQSASMEDSFGQPRSKNKTFSGHVVDEKGGSVRLTIDQDFIYGFFRYDGEAYFIEPLKQFYSGATPDQFLFYKASDVNPVQGQKCALNEIKNGIGKHIQEQEVPTEKMTGLCYTVEIALAADFSMFSQFGSVTATENQVLGILNLVQTNYDDDFDDEITFQVVTVFVSDCSACDPWTSSNDAGTLLTSFANWGNTGGFGVNFDVATLWTNRDFIGDTIGVAWPGTLCTSQRYNTCQNFSFNASLLRVLQAHELGHNFNAGHDNPGSNTIMAPSVINTNSWSATSQSTISSYIASVGSSGGCFTNCAPAQPPVASIFAPVNNVCPGSAVPFFDNSSNNPTSWSWNFPGGSPSASNQQNPTVVYELPGSYPVILTVTNDVGTDATSLSFDINVTDAGTKYIVYETFELGPTHFNIENPDGAITWEITNVGGTQGGTRAIYVNNYDYDAAGQKDALVSFPFDFSMESDIMMELDYAYRRYNNNLKDKLRILISLDGGNTFPFTAFQGDETGSGNFATAPDSQAPFTPAVQNDWCYGTDFGADCISIDLSSLSGEPNVVIKIENETGFGNNLYVDNLKITSACQPLVAPSAAFTADVQDGCVPVEINFESQSSGVITNYNWSFPGGTPSFSTMQNPSVTYHTPGVYDVILVVSNGAGSSTAEEFAYVIVQGEPEVAFNYEVEDLTVFFDNQTVDGTSFLWDFGDGNTSNAFNPNHSYSTAGEYTAVLSVTNNCGTSSFEQVITVTSPLSAAFSASEITGCANFEVTFTDESIGDVDTWEWAFEGGNPTNSSEANPTVTYEQAGTFAVSLTISNNFGETTTEEVGYITVEDVPMAAFDINYILGELSATFNNQSSNAESYTWDFGDGNTSSDGNPTHTYDEDGTYTVQLIATNPCGNDTTELEVTILTPPLAGFSANSTAGCSPFEVEFTGQPAGEGLTYSWVFEGGNPSTSMEANPTIIYENAGQFNVSLTVTNAAGSDTHQESSLIAVDSLPTAGFDISSTLGENQVSFSNTSSNAESYTWDFGDGSATSSSLNPNHTYTMDSTYTIQLIAINPCGNDTITHEVTILSPPVAGFMTDNTEGCAPFEVEFSAQPSGKGLTYNWAFEGGQPASSMEANPTVTYENSGVFGVSLIVSNAAGSDTIEETTYIMVDSLPTAGFDISSTLGENQVSFNNTSINAESYTWDFGDGSANSSSLNPSHTYTMDSTYTIQLIAINPCGNDTITQEVTILSPPIAGFTADTASGCAPFEVEFSAQPTGDGLTYDWTFDGGNPSSSTVANPTVMYETSGLFGVSLVVSNAAGSDTITEQEWIEVDSLPTADFEITTTLGESTVDFTNASTNAETYIWDFGDGSEGSTETSPSHTYESDSTYTIQLIAINPCGNDTTLQEVIILSPPVAGFDADVNSGCAPFEVSFTGQPVGDSLTYAWAFEGGNPTTSDDPNPTVSYEIAGLFGVSLIVSNAAGSDTITEQEWIEVGDGPNAGFEVDYTLGDNFANFTDTSENAAGYFWDFGDGDTSNMENPSHEYLLDGTYVVTLIVENECGFDTLNQEITIITPPKADFLADITGGCAPVEVQFSSQAPEQGTAFSWLFEGGNPDTSSQANPTVIYESAGSYGVQLVVSNAAGADTAILENYIIVEDIPDAGFSSLVNGFTVQFDNTSVGASIFEWDFGDGNGSEEEAPTHVYESEGTYTVSLTVSNDCGSTTLSDTIEISVDFPTADFTANIMEGCAPLVVQFTNLSENADSVAWSFHGGMPATSSQLNPMVTYNDPGIFGVSLTAYNNFGEAVVITEELISVISGPTAAFDFAVSETMVAFSNNSDVATSYAWNFGDGSISDESDPIHVFQGAGTFLVQLIASNECGSDTLSQEVTIEGMAPVPALQFDVERGCLPLTVQFTDISEGNPSSWEWLFEGGDPMSSNEQHPSITYEQAGVFEVSLAVTNAFGTNTEVFSALITVLDIPVADFAYEMDGLMVHFQSLSSGDDLNYEWLFGDGTNSAEVHPIHTYAEGGTYEVSMIVSNECGADTIIREIELIIDKVDTPEWIHQLELFPNPNDGRFSLILEGFPQPLVQIQMINVIGQELYKEALDFKTGFVKKEFDFSSLPAGIYLLQLRSGNRFVYKKVVVE